MKTASFTNLVHNDAKITTKLILETSFSKEIAILLKQGQIMKEHVAPFPIIVHILDGEILFNVEGKDKPLNTGDIITLEGNIPHSLTAKKNSTVRLTISKLDHAARVEKVANNG